ncbi:MAG: trypsin-like peptidase domain-containing protein [Pseudomonadota bacterium]|nr:trypsin-like peptidase domain-containing protein [Pseudomonadota bacterium]
MSGPNLRAPTNTDLDELSGLVAVPLPTFSQVFLRAQKDRDVMVDIGEVSAGEADERARVRACYAYAKEKEFLKLLLRSGLDEEIAGTPDSPSGKAFARLASQLAGISVQPIMSPSDAAAFQAEAINEEGFDSDPMRLSGQIRTAMRSVCKIVDTENNCTGTGVLIAPHLVVTAAHVVAMQIDQGKPREGSASRIEIKLDQVANLPGAEPERVEVADDWLVDWSPWHDAMIQANGTPGVLPPEGQLIEHDDIIVIRLKEAPGFLRGWLKLADPADRFDGKRKGLIFHHHPGGGDQKVSVGRYCGAYGPRFKHDCSSLGGSSGGPVINAAAQIAGVHHGTITEGSGQVNLGGGAAQLLLWRSAKADYDTPRVLNPVWEIRKTGTVGSGQPVIGFEDFQRRVWDLELSGNQAALFVQGSSLAGRLVFDIIDAMFPADRALVVRFDRVLLNDIIAALSGQADMESQTAVAIAEIAKRIGNPGPDRGERHSTDPVEARAAAPAIGEALRSLPPDRTIWILVNIGDLDVPTPLSEALAYLYQACLRIDGGRGRLLVSGADPRIRQKIETLVQGVFDRGIEMHALGDPDVDDVKRYFLRCAQETKNENLQMPAIAQMIADACVAMAKMELKANGGDFYPALENAVKLLQRSGP